MSQRHIKDDDVIPITSLIARLPGRLAAVRLSSALTLVWAAVIVAAVAIPLGGDKPRSMQLLGSTTGGFTQTNSRCDNVKLTCSAIFNSGPLVPGRTGNIGTVTIKNTGSAATFTLSQTNLVDSPTSTTLPKLSQAVYVKVEDITVSSLIQTIYNGNVASFPAAGISLNRWRTGDAHTYRFTPYWPSGSVGNNYQGLTTTVTYKWSQS